jgi:flagellar M-ring protein FliF
MSGFSSGQKAMLGMAVLAVVLGGYLFMGWAGKPSYVPLFSNLSSSDAAAITQKLATNKIPYELAEGGEQIMVPENDVYQQRLDMAADGLPSSGDQGYSLLDTAGVTTSEFQQQVEYQQAVSDELEQTIESVTGVSSAQVSVVIPQESLFSSSADQPSASVLVTLDPGSSLTAEQVQAIVHLVASSVEGLSPDNVTVADSNGDVLNAPGTDAGNVAAGTMDEQETDSYDQELDNSLQEMLATVLGAGNAVVHASAQLDFDQTQISSQIYDPNNQAPIPVQQASSKETYTGANASQAAQGVLGSSATTLPVDAASTPVTSAATTSSKTTKTTKTTKGAKSGGATSNSPTTTVANGSSTSATTVPSYVQSGSSQSDVVSEVNKTVNSAPGALEQMSIAVVVNSSVKGVTQQQITQLVSAAAGLQTSRGDTIQVAFVPFNQSAAKAQAAQVKAAASATSKDAMMSEIRGVLVVLAVLGLLVFSIRRINKTTRVPMALPAPIPAEVAQIGQMIEQEPERIAEMLRTWLETGPGER